MEYNLNIADNKGTVTMTGRFTFADNQAMREILEKCEGGPVSNCTLNVQGLEFVDSAGLGMFILANDTFIKKGGTFSLESPRGQVKKMLDLTRFSDIISIKD